MRLHMAWLQPSPWANRITGPLSPTVLTLLRLLTFMVFK
jgi:hypothetical protein